MSKHVLAYLDGGPANGQVVELDEPHWAPLGALRIEVDGTEYVYLRADQPRPPEGQPWRYVPETEQSLTYPGPGSGTHSSTEDLYDD
jgi:hypothetical protein